LVAVAVASSVGYILGHYFGQFFADRILGRKTEQKIEGFLEDYGFWAVAITCFNLTMQSVLWPACSKWAIGNSSQPR
jgi:membrane protein DedA with SNARE-associated domain